jgi:hypothetical protein
MKRLMVCAAAIAAACVGACSPDASAPAATPGQPFATSKPSPATPATASSPVQAAPSVSLAGKWAGTITCYKIEAPLQMTIDAAKPGEAVMSKGEGGALSWPATVSVSEVARLVTVVSTGPADGAERVEGLLSEDGSQISGVMDKQLCTGFSLKRQT